jgi:hypothetical protein
MRWFASRLAVQAGIESGKIDRKPVVQRHGLFVARMASARREPANVREDAFRGRLKAVEMGQTAKRAMPENGGWHFFC